MASETPLDTAQPRPSGDLEWWEMRNLQFKVLVLGRANAGKTTILERLANASADETMIFRKENRSKTVGGRILQTLTGRQQQVKVPVTIEGKRSVRLA